MKLAAELGSYPASRPLNADQILEYHAARLVLLIYTCGTKAKIHGLTKLAKLDFFVRYPPFFKRAADALGESLKVTDTHGSSTESSMVRHHYGPWDPRYYDVLAYLEGRELIDVQRDGKAFVFALTPSGSVLAKRLAGDPAFLGLVSRMKKVKALFGGKSGDWLKKLVYRVFDDEVARLVRGQIIR